ncbi:MAG: hypothetical protein J5940_00625 [Clostridia bacterium]|nr:hypothetical protein [Clostridia bacterium]
MKDKESNKEELLNEIYGAACMGSDSIMLVTGKISDGALKNELKTQLDGYRNFAVQAENALVGMGKTAKRPGVFKTVPATVSISLKTMADSSESHVAEMMVNGLTMGVIEMKRQANNAVECQVDADAVKLANDMVAFQENSINQLKQYL